MDIVISRMTYRERQSLEQAFSDLPSVRLTRTTNFGLAGSTRLTKMLVMGLYAIQAAAYSLFGPSVDLNVFLSQPPFFPVWGLILSRLRKQPYMCVVMDVHPDEAVAFGLMRREALVTGVLAWLMRSALKKARHVVVIGRCMGLHLQQAGVHAERIQFIANWADERVVFPVEHAHNPLRTEWGLAGKFVVLHAGNVGFAHGFDEMIAVAQSLQDRHDITFVFIGSGSRMANLQERVAALCLENFQFRPFVPMSQWANAYGVGDIHLVVLREACTGLGVPSRAYGSLAAGRPILYVGSAKGEIARMVREADVGTVVQPSDSEGLRQAILSYADRPTQVQTQGRKAAELSQDRYSRQRALKAYVEVLLGGQAEEPVRRLQ